MRVQGAVTRGAPVELYVAGRAVPAYIGESVAAALWAAGIRVLRHSPRDGDERGAFCMMGACQECVVRIGGRVVQSCMEPVRAGLEIELG